MHGSTDKPAKRLSETPRRSHFLRRVGCSAMSFVFVPKLSQFGGVTSSHPPAEVARTRPSVAPALLWPNLARTRPSVAQHTLARVCCSNTHGPMSIEVKRSGQHRPSRTKLARHTWVEIAPMRSVYTDWRHVVVVEGRASRSKVASRAAHVEHPIRLAFRLTPDARPLI